MLDDKLSEYIETVSSSSSTPGGGNVAAVVNSLGCSLMLMSLRIAILKKENNNKEALQTESSLEEIKKRSLFLAGEDSRVFSEVMKSYSAGGEKLLRALKNSASVSLDIARAATGLICIIEEQDLKKFANIITDVGIALELARAAYESSLMNYRINTAGLKKSDKSLEKSRYEISRKFEKIFPALRKKVIEVIN